MIKAQFTGCSHYSHLGASSIKDIISTFQKNGYEYGTITEYGNINSAVEFYAKCKKEGLKPIIGVQVYVEDTWSPPQYGKKSARGKLELQKQYGLLTLHFLTQEAYLEFCKLTPTLADRIVSEMGEDRPILTIKEIEHLDGFGITVGLSGIDGLIGRVYDLGQKKLASEIFNDLAQRFANVYIEINPLPLTHRWFKPVFDRKDDMIRPGQFVENTPEDNIDGIPDINKALNLFMIELNEQSGMNLPLIPSLSFQFATEDQKMVQDVKLSYKGKPVLQSYVSNHIRSPQEVQDLLANSGILPKYIEMMNQNINKWASQFDSFKIDTAKDRWIMRQSDGDLFKRLKKSFDVYNRINWNDPIQVERIKMEIDILAKNGKINFLHYLFTIADAAEWCKNNDLLMSVRGSAGASLVLYGLGVSAFNPLDYDLQFERFLTHGRIQSGSLPDVDIDLSNQGRFVEEYLIPKYGDSVCRISTDILLKIKSSIQDAERAILGSVRKETEALTKSLPDAPQGTSSEAFIFGSDDSPGLIDTHAELKKYAKDNPEIWKYVSQMLGIMRQKSQHPCGFVIADGPVHEYIPVTHIKGSKVTGLNPKQVEEAGLIKFDFLGVNTLKDIQACVKSIKERTGEDIDPFHLPYDEGVFDLFEAGDTETVFQFNTPTVIPYLKKIKPRDIAGLSAVTALCRPGALDAPSGDGRTLAEVFVARAEGEPIEYVHPDLKPILEETYGVMIFQEQNLRIFRDLAGYSYEQAEVVRRGIGKKDREVLESCMGDLKNSCLKRGWTEEQVDLLIEQIMASSNYGFNKAHSTSYGVNAYACMYLKKNYPLDWWRAVLSNADKNEVATLFWNHVKGFASLPMINKSGDDYQIVDDKIVAPLSIISGMGAKSYQSLIEHAPYDSLEDFVDIHFGKKNRTQRSALNTGTTIKLIAAGVLDPLFPKELVKIEDKILLFNQTKAQVRRERSVEAVPEQYVNLSKIERFLIKKSLIKVYSEDLRDLVLPGLGGKKNDLGQWTLTLKELKYKGPATYCSGSNYHRFKEKIENQDMMLPREIYFGAVAYVLDEKTFTYHNKTKQATKIWIDINGFVSEEVVWPPWEGSIAEYGFKNHICLVIFKAREGSDGKQRIGIHDIRPVLTK